MKGAGHAARFDWLAGEGIGPSLRTQTVWEQCCSRAQGTGWQRETSHYTHTHCPIAFGCKEHKGVGLLRKQSAKEIIMAADGRLGGSNETKQARSSDFRAVLSP